MVVAGVSDCHSARLYTALYLMKRNEMGEDPVVTGGDGLPRVGILLKTTYFGRAPHDGRKPRFSLISLRSGERTDQPGSGFFHNRHPIALEKRGDKFDEEVQGRRPRRNLRPVFLENLTLSPLSELYTDKLWHLPACILIGRDWKSERRPCTIETGPYVSKCSNAL